MRSIGTSLSIFFDKLKDFIIFTLLILLIALFICFIVHNVLKMVDLFNTYSGAYKNIAETQNGDHVNVYTVGEGEKTIVILPGFGVQSPVLMYKNIAEELKNEYKVVIIEYPGYGFADATKEERSNENFAKDIKEALEFKKIYGPYVLMPHSISNLYAMKFVEMYPDLVDGVIAIDGLYPSIINTKEGENYINDTRTNIKITSIMEYTGFARVLSYVKPEVFNIDLLKKTNVIKDKDIKLYRKFIATKYLTSSMVKEIENLNSNASELKEYQYPNELKVLNILAKDTVDESKKIYSNKTITDFAEKTISNPELQQIKTIKGTHMLTLSNPIEVIQEIGNFSN